MTDSAEFTVEPKGVRVKWPAAVGIVAFLLGAGIVYAQVRAEIAQKADAADVAILRTELRDNTRLLCAIATPQQRQLSGVPCPSPYSK